MPIQEDLQNKTVMVSIQSAKLSLKAVRKIAVMIMNLGKGVKHGKQSLRQLNGQNRGLTNIDITKENLKGLERLARKYGIDYAIKKDSTFVPPKWCLFFKAQDAELLSAALNEYARKLIKKSIDKPSVAAEIAKCVAQVKNVIIPKTKNKVQGGPEL